MKFSWHIESTDESLGTAVVAYKREGFEPNVLNIPQPPDGEEIGEWISKFAPVRLWELADRPKVLTPGMVGTAEIAPPTPAPAVEQPNVQGSYYEEYLRALIYQVIEEIREAEV